MKMRIQLELEVTNLSVAEVAKTIEEAIERAKEAQPALVLRGRVLAIRAMRRLP